MGMTASVLRKSGAPDKMGGGGGGGGIGTLTYTFVCTRYSYVQHKFDTNIILVHFQYKI